MESRLANIFIIQIGSCAFLAYYLSVLCSDSYLNSNGYEFYINLIIKYLIIVSLSYFVLDFILMIKNYKLSHKIYFIHHSIAIISILVVITKYHNLMNHLIGYLMFELSTPFLNISKYYKKKKIYNCTSKIFNILFVLVFTLVRIIFGSWLSYDLGKILFNFTFPYCFLIILPILLHSLNLWWFYKIINILISSFTN